MCLSENSLDTDGGRRNFCGKLIFVLMICEVTRSAAARSAGARYLLCTRRREEACLACLERADSEAVDRGSRFNTSRRICERLAAGLADLPLRLFSRSRSARLRVDAEVAPFLGAGRSTPARRAFERPIAIACFGDRAPCLPSRMCSISSCTNSPAWVVGALPSALSCFARSIVSFSGIYSSKK